MKRVKEIDPYAYESEGMGAVEFFFVVERIDLGRSQYFPEPLLE